MSLERKPKGYKIKPEKCNQTPLKTFISRGFLEDLYGIGKSAMDSQIKLIEGEIKERIPSFQLSGKKNYTIREQEVIFELLGNPLKEDI